jgi:hypothetical protein
MDPTAPCSSSLSSSRTFATMLALLWEYRVRLTSLRLGSHWDGVQRPLSTGLSLASHRWSRRHQPVRRPLVVESRTNRDTACENWRIGGFASPPVAA